MDGSPGITCGASGAARAESPSSASTSAGTIYNLIGRLAFLVGGYPLHIGLARILGPVRYGMVGAVLPLVMIASVLVMNGPRQAISKFTAEHAGLATVIRAAALRVQGLFGGIVLLIILASAGVVAGVLRDPGLAVYIRLAAPIVLVMAIYSVYVASLNGLHAFGRQAAAMVVFSLGRVLFALAGAWLWGVAGALVGLATGPLVGLLVARQGLPRGRGEGHFPARRILTFSLPMIVFSAGETPAPPATILSATKRSFFLQSQVCRTSGTVAPQEGFLQRTVRVQR